jgi:small subunit ribosomal protein S18
MMKKRRSTTKVARADKSLTFTYKEPGVLEKYVSEQGYIVPRSKTGLAQKQQRQLSRAIKHARHLAMLPFTQTL